MIRILKNEYIGPHELCLYCDSKSVYNVEVVNDEGRFKFIPVCKNCLHRLKVEFANMDESHIIDPMDSKSN